MGEYARYQGQQIKIGTCEEMYYLRADQAHDVTALPGNVDPTSKDRFEIRFRFPWPNEDKILPGAFEGVDRGLMVSGVTPSSDLEHETVQFSAGPGYLVSLPCPESLPLTPSGTGNLFHFYPDGDDARAITIHRNGYKGGVHIIGQKWLNTSGVGQGDTLCTIAMCGGCGSKYRLATLASALPVIDVLYRDAALFEQPHVAGFEPTRAAWYRQVAIRIAAGYSERPFAWEGV